MAARQRVRRPIIALPSLALQQEVRSSLGDQSSCRACEAIVWGVRAKPAPEAVAKRKPRRLSLFPE